MLNKILSKKTFPDLPWYWCPFCLPVNVMITYFSCTKCGLYCQMKKFCAVFEYQVVWEMWLEMKVLHSWNILVLVGIMFENGIFLR